jgi:ADP-heptose:LPS heptosyltransferase
MYIIFQIDGGIGKSVMATAVLKAMRKKHTKDYIIVVTSYPDVFINNPNANKVLNFNQLNGIYSNYIMDKDCKVFMADPYTSSDFITEKQHVIKTWCDLYDIPYNGENPEIFISQSEKDYFQQFYRLDKPIMVIQPHGGAQNQALKYSWTRDIPQPIMEEVIEYFKNDYAILHVKREDQIIYPNTLQALDSFRSLAILLTMSSKRFLIDSSMMHVAAAFNLPSTICWVGTNPEVFGYSLHNNIVANEPTKPINLEHSFYTKHLLFEDISSIPYHNLKEVFDTQKIIESLKSH